MLLRFIFRRMSIKRQVSFLKRNGVALGTRVKDGRRIYIYILLRDLFVEVIYKGDCIENEPEKLSMLKGLDNLNDYLEKEFRSTF